MILLMLPTAIVGYLLLREVSLYFNMLTDKAFLQSVYFSAGLFISCLFYGYRFRFFTTSMVVFLLFLLLYKITGQLVIGEFDTFYASFEVLLFLFLFLSGWITAYGIVRSRYFTILFAGALLLVQIIMISRTTDFELNHLFVSFIPWVAYSVFLIYASEMLRNMNASEPAVFSFLSKRFIGFSFLLLLAVLIVSVQFEREFKVLEKEWAGGSGGKGESESMTKRNADGSISNKNKSELSGSLSKGKQLIFVARLDNFFQDGQTPNPLYFTAYYYTKYDTVTQTFMADSLMPDNDLFRPDPSKIPLFFNEIDSSKIVHSKGYLDRKVVTTDVYKVALSPEEFIAPSTAFYCQPIPVPEEYKSEYASAYKAKMWVSDLNSAYFIYNPGNNPVLREFQEQRFSALRKMTSWYHTDPAFYRYYTRMPSGADFDSIRTLAKQITDTAHTPVDKIIAIRNFFTSKDQWNQPLFTYSDNPGVPGIPSANKLNYFLFSNRKGYCSYFAGATLFMLRSLGIPSRIAAGFLTIDRSTKNPGWYWFYQDQAHAWVQVYFPGYGWIDFDTTIPDENTRESEQPDQTPPLNMPQPYFVADGFVKTIDTVQKTMSITAKRFLIQEKEINSQESLMLPLNLSVAAISNDTGVVGINFLKPGMHITAASYSETLKDLQAQEGQTIEKVLAGVNLPVPVDEVKIISSEKKADKKSEGAEKESVLDIRQLLISTLIIAAALLVLLFAFPYLIFVYFDYKAKLSSGSVESKAYAVNRAVSYYLNQMKFRNPGKAPQIFAREIDRRFNTNYYSFNQLYQKLKYGNAGLDEKDNDFIKRFYPQFIQLVSSGIPVKTRFLNFLSISNTISFFRINKKKNRFTNGDTA